MVKKLIIAVLLTLMLVSLVHAQEFVTVYDAEQTDCLTIPTEDVRTYEGYMIVQSCQEDYINSLVPPSGECPDCPPCEPDVACNPPSQSTCQPFCKQSECPECKTALISDSAVNSVKEFIKAPGISYPGLYYVLSIIGVVIVIVIISVIIKKRKNRVKGPRKQKAKAETDSDLISHCRDIEAENYLLRINIAKAKKVINKLEYHLRLLTRKYKELQDK